MECLNCGAPVLDNGYCSECGLNYRLLAKAYNTSNYYYNIGLDKAGGRDLTGAIDALRTSLKYNKQNINARNLLGLIYYEMGEIGLGLTQWVISQNYLPGEHNISYHYINEVQSDSVQLEEANQLARQYNTALTYAKQGTKDLALMQLKRILGGHPHFVKGYLLLALLYIDSGYLDKATKALKRVLRIDRNNTLAMKYLSEMGYVAQEIRNIQESSRRIDENSAYDEDKPDGSDLETFVRKSLENIDKPDLSVGSYKEINHNKFNLIYVSVGLILGILVFSLLILPTKLKSAKREARDQQIAYSEDVSKKNVKISDLEEQVAELEQQIADEAKAVEKKENEAEEADNSFAVIKKHIPNTAYATLCTEADAAIAEHDYEKAITLCKVALQIQSGEEAYYYLGKAYLGNQENDKAKEAFTTLKASYPESSHIEEVSDYLGD